jgi:hypothetical protein
MNVRSITATAGATVLLLGGTAANAAAHTYQFTITGDYSAAWQVSSALAPNDIFVGESFTVWSVAGAFPGASTPVTDLTFFNAGHGGGMSIFDFNAGVSLLSSDGPQLFSGTESSPTFLLGTFTLTEYRGAGHYSLAVTQVGEVPEPGSMALVLCGLMSVGCVRRLWA